MDVVWALADPPLGSGDVVQQVVEAMEKTQSWRLRESLYTHLLPTVGPRILDTLFKRLEATAKTDDLPLLNSIVEGITSFGGGLVAPKTTAVLGHESPFVQRAAMRVLQKRPSAAALDRLWVLHTTVQSDPQGHLRKGEHHYAAYEDSFGALKSCVALDPDWLGRAVERADPQTEPVESLAYLLAALDESANLWERHRDTLFHKVRPDKERCLAINIGKHRDAENVNWLLERIDCEGDLLGACALRAYPSRPSA